MSESGAYCGDYICSGDIDNFPSGSDYDDWKAIIDKIEQLIDKTCHTHFGGEAFDIKINGNAKNRLFLPLKSDIITVTYVAVSCIEMPSTWYTWDKNSIFLDPCVSGAGYTFDPELIFHLSAVYEQGIFPRGYDNIWIKGTYGSEGDVPEAIKQAAIILAKWENDPTLYTNISYKKSEKIGDYSYTNLAGEQSEILTGILEADQFLRLYIKRKPIIMAP